MVKGIKQFSQAEIADFFNVQHVHYSTMGSLIGDDIE